jgi:hypothetical protein
MTYGQLKLRLTQAFPGISLDLIEGWANDRYQEILGELPWTRQNIQAVLQTRTPYTAGTVAVTAGSNAVVLTGGSWTASLTGLAFRVKGETDYYEFTITSSTSGTLDRPYDGPSASAAAYAVYQAVYVLPAGCQLLADDAFVSPLGPMRRYTHEQLNASDPTRATVGTARAWAGYMDDDSTPPRMQVEIYPNPNESESLLYTYQSYGGDLDAEAKLLELWIQPAALLEGITARIKAHLKDYTGANFHTALAKAALATMRTSEAQGMAPAQMKLSSYYTGHRARRWKR